MPTYQSSSSTPHPVQVYDYVHQTFLAHEIPDPQVVEERELLVARVVLYDEFGGLAGKAIRWEITGPASASFSRSTDGTGASTLAVYFDQVGNYSITPYFDGETYLTSAVGTTLPVTVSANYIITTTVLNIPSTATVGVPITVNSVSIDSVAAVGLEGAPVTLYIDDVPQTQKLTVNGIATWSITFTLADIGAHIVKAVCGEYSTSGTVITPQ